MTSAGAFSSERLWESHVPRFGVVRVVLLDGDHAARLDDVNADGREVVLDLFRWGDGAWQHLASHDDVGLPGLDDSPACGWSDERSWAVGRARPGDRLEVTWYDERAVVEADADGWWLAVLHAEPPHDEDPIDPLGPLWERGPRVRPIE